MRTTQAEDNTRFADRYRLTERLHTGANTEVWLAVDTRADIPVALKILDRSAAERASIRGAFEHEWQIARSLNHPHTVRGLGFVDNERPAYAMQYIDGTDFSDLVGQPYAVWAAPLLVIIDTLVYWHRKGVVHADIKPSNCLLDRRGVAYLTDFGAARLIDKEAGSAPRDMGSPAYASPEQQAGSRPECADDVYALGQVIAELASGNPATARLDSVPPAISKMVAAARRERADRPSLIELRDAIAATGISRGQPDLQALNINLRRPASSIAGSVQAVPEVSPYGGFATNDEHAQPGGISARQVVLGLLAIVVFGVLFTQTLRWLGQDDRPQNDRTPTQTPPDVTANSNQTAPEAEVESVSEPTESQRVADRAAGEQALGALLSVTDILKQRGAELWGGIEYTEGLRLYETGDRAYLAGDFGLANERYQAALNILRPLTERIDAEFEKAMRTGDQALLDEDADAALAAFTMALQITPNDPLATTGVERANNLNDVLRLMTLGDLAARSGAFEEALEQYEAALALDANWQPAQKARADMLAALGGQQFTRLMSQGIGALDEGRFAAATRALEQAAAMRPNDSAPRDALLQVRLAERLQRINGLQTQAEQAEAGEQWQSARTLYQSMLDIDADLDAAQAGLLRVGERIALMGESASVLANPDSLSKTEVLREASALLTQLDALSPRGAELAARIDALTALLKSAALPIPVTLRSDGLTSVALLQVSRLGEFESTEVRLRPGLYTLVGSRRGYVDVRRQFRVRAGQTPASVYIACDQPI